MSVDGLWNCVMRGDTGMECKQMCIPAVLRCLKGGTRKGPLWLPLRETEDLGIEEMEETLCIVFSSSCLQCF